MQISNSPNDAPDLTECDREQIQHLGRIQSFGGLVAVSHDWIITHASENLAEFVGPQDKFLGAPLSDILSDDAIETIRSNVIVDGTDDATTRVFDVDLGGGRSADLSLHEIKTGLIIEFERVGESSRSADVAAIQNLAARLKNAGEIEDVSRKAAQSLRTLTGFDRVMVYRFNEDQSGTVIAEAAGSSERSFVGLRFPATDIPTQARALYLRSTLRLIENVNAETVPVVPASDAYGNPLDLSLSVTRAVSEVHLEYLRNMGVSASMSVSIICEGKLWGLFACHHDAPKYIDFRMRTAVELFARLFSYEIVQRENQRETEELQIAQDFQQRLMTRAASGGLFTNAELLHDEIRKIIAFDGMALISSERSAVFGRAPAMEHLPELVQFLATTARGKVFATHSLQTVAPDLARQEPTIAGMLALPISREPRDYIILFRTELAQQATWAGNPEKSVTRDGDNLRLSPRKSFEMWREVIRGQSAPWSEREKISAEIVRVTLIEVVLKLTEEANQERKRAAERQEVLIAELNHRVRNILNLIQSLLQTTTETAENFDALKSALSGRIAALARAHDILTSSGWKPSSLFELIRAEAEAFADRNAAAVNLHGPDPEMDPRALNTMALVIHELITNSTKYGALSVPEGTIDIVTTWDPTTGLELSWTERGGPRPKLSDEPRRRGFGSTIIDNAVPYELKGTASVELREEGLEGRFTLPPEHVADTKTTSARAEAPRGAAPVAVAEPVSDLPGSVLVVEDNMVIGMGTVALLETAGVNTVYLTASVDESLDIMTRNSVDFAVLDVNLGDTTSEPIAKALSEKGVPFVLASGYSDVPGDGFGGAPVLQKPFSGEALIGLMRDTWAQSGG